MLVKERPMLYSTDMVVSILEDRKKKTRRMTGLEMVNEFPDLFDLVQVHYRFGEENPEALYATFSSDRVPDDKFDFLLAKYNYAQPTIKCPYGKPGDLLWVRETWAMETAYQGHAYWYLYKTAYDSPVAWNWKPSIHMPKDAARIWLQITDIRVERVQTISTSDAISEGIKSKTEQKKSGPCTFYKDYCNRNDWYWSAKASFMSLWQKINGRESWRANPWVWVISFKVLSKTGRPSVAAAKAPHGFCVTPDSTCTMNYCDDNGCVDRKRVGTGKEVANG